jgi:ABC-2 type transport system permease protein
MIAQAIAGNVAPIADAPVRNAEIELGIMRISPNTLFSEATTALLLPSLSRFMIGVVTMGQAAYMLDNPLSLGQSAILIWPQLTTLIGLSAICFAASYVIFMRQEVRAT